MSSKNQVKANTDNSIAELISQTNSTTELNVLASEAPNLASSSMVDERKGHPSREMEARDMGGRVNEQMRDHYRKVFTAGTKGKTHFEAEIVPQGMVYGYKAVSVLNRPLTSNLNEAHRNGWSFVPIDRHPHLIIDSTKNYIEIEGLALMERPREIHDLQEEVTREEGRKQQAYMSAYVQLDSLSPAPQPGRDYKPIEGYSYNLSDADRGGFQGYNPTPPQGYQQNQVPPQFQGPRY